MSTSPKYPERIYAQVSPRSQGGISLFDISGPINLSNVDSFRSAPDIVRQAKEQFINAGFEVLQPDGLPSHEEVTFNIAGSLDTYQRALNATIQPKELPVIKALGQPSSATFLDDPRTPLLGLISTEGTMFADVAEGVALDEPRYCMVATLTPPVGARPLTQPSPFAPDKPYWHLRIPGDLALATNAPLAHRSGVTGQGVKVAMVDSGWYQHPYFVSQGYRVAPVTLGPGAINPLDDESGHGTGESANIFALAPDVSLYPVKTPSSNPCTGGLLNTIGAFNAAIALRPDIITCSWGGDKELPQYITAADRVLAASIAVAVASGITVIFSAGNGSWGFPGQHPDVISAGGTYLQSDGSYIASNYASGFMSKIYPNRRVPDLCGLVGQMPKAIYIMLPVQPRDCLDRELAGDVYPNGDETGPDDGWAAFSGTSAAAPQLAGAAALVKQACPNLTPADIKSILCQTARDVMAGTCHPRFNHPATPGPDLATGYGVVDAYRAVKLAKLRNLTQLQIHDLESMVLGSL